MNDKPGVYAIRNTHDGKRYIGSTNNKRHRLASHRGMLRKGTHVNRRLQTAWNDSGEAAFAFETVEECRNEHCAAVEQVMIDYYKATDERYGYNMAEIAGIGGHRPGAGRPPAYGTATICSSVSITPDVREYLKSCEGGISRELERLVREEAGFQSWLKSKAIGGES